MLQMLGQVPMPGTVGSTVAAGEAHDGRSPMGATQGAYPPCIGLPQMKW